MLKVHILNVGHGDCIISEFPSGRLTVVDINRSQQMDMDSLMEILALMDPSKASLNRILHNMGLMDYHSLIESAGYYIQLTDPISYIYQLSRNRYNIFSFISTHPHMDHLTGLFDLYQTIKMANAWVLPNSFTQHLSRLSETQKADWELYKFLRDGKQSTIKVITPLAGDMNNFWADEGIKILAPNQILLNTADNNNDANSMSYVLLIKYGYSKIILGGDAEEVTWKYIVENFKDEIENIHLLKASHHGRDRGYYQPAVKLMSPAYTVVSVGKQPKNDDSNKYRQYSDHVVSTRWHGTMVFELDKFGHINFLPEHER